MTQRVSWNTPDGESHERDYDQTHRTTRKIRDLLDAGITDITVTQTVEATPEPLRFQLVTQIKPGDVAVGDFAEGTTFNRTHTRAYSTVEFDGERWTHLDGSPTNLPTNVFAPKTWAELTRSGDDGGYGLVSLVPMLG